MNFDEAIKFKNNIGEKYTQGDIEYIVTIAPENKDDLEMFCSDYINNDFTDESAKKYSLNKMFEVYALQIQHGILLLRKKLS